MLYQWAVLVFEMVMAHRVKLTPKTTKIILDKLSEGCSIRAACEAANIARRTYYEWRAEHPEFLAQTESAIETGTDRLEDVALERATRAIDSSDTLLIFLLKARRPHTYRETIKQEISGPGGEPLQFAGVLVPLPAREDDGE